MFFAVGVIDAERGMNIGAGHGALASVGEHELAALGERLGFWRPVEAIVMGVGIRPGSEALWRNMIVAGGERAIVGLVRREIIAIEVGGILDGTRRRRRVVAVG